MGIAPEPGTAHLYLGNDPTRWRRDVPMYGAGRYAALIPGVDLDVAAEPGGLALTWRLVAGADPDAIRWSHDEATALRVVNRALHVELPSGTWVHPAPIAWQDGPQGRREVEVSWRIEAQTVGYALGHYDPELPLTVDPGARFFTALGVSTVDTLVGSGMSAAHEVILAGHSLVASFLQRAPALNTDGFVVRYRPDGQVESMIVLGGQRDDGTNRYCAQPTATVCAQWAQRPEGFGGREAAFDAAMNLGPDTGLVALVGETEASDFPEVSPFSIGHNGVVAAGYPTADGFISLVDPFTGDLRMSSQLGGSLHDALTSVVLPPSIPRVAVFAGNTRSPDLQLPDVNVDPSTGYDSFWGIVSVDGRNITGERIAGPGDEYIEDLAWFTDPVAGTHRVAMIGFTTSDAYTTATAANFASPPLLGGVTSFLMTTDLIGPQAPTTSGASWTHTTIAALGRVDLGGLARTDGGWAVGGEARTPWVVASVHGATPLYCARRLGRCAGTSVSADCPDVSGTTSTPDAFVMVFPDNHTCSHHVQLGGSDLDRFDALVASGPRLYALGATRSVSFSGEDDPVDPQPMLGGDADAWLAGLDLSDPDAVLFTVRVGATNDLAWSDAGFDRPGEYGLALGLHDARPLPGTDVDAETEPFLTVGLRSTGVLAPVFGVQASSVPVPLAWAGTFPTRFADAAVRFTSHPTHVDQVGDPVPFTVQLSNKGPEDLEAATFEVRIDPTLLRVDSAPSSCRPVASDPGLYRCDLLSLDRGGDRDHAFATTSLAAGRVQLTARLTSTAPVDPIEHDNRAEAFVDIAVPRLTLIGSDGDTLRAWHKDTATANRPLVMRGTIRNDSAVDAPLSKVVVQAAAPVRLNLLAPALTETGTLTCGADLAGTRVECDVPPIPARGFLPVTLPIAAEVTDPALLVTRAEVSAALTVSWYHPATATAVTREQLGAQVALRLPDLDASSTALDETTASPGDTVQLVLDVDTTDPGDVAATLWTIRLPPELTVPSAPTGCERTVSAAGTTMTCIGAPLSGTPYAATFDTQVAVASNAPVGRYRVVAGVQMRAPGSTTVLWADPAPGDNLADLELIVGPAEFRVEPPNPAHEGEVHLQQAVPITLRKISGRSLEDGALSWNVSAPTASLEVNSALSCVPGASITLGSCTTTFDQANGLARAFTHTCPITRLADTVTCSLALTDTQTGERSHNVQLTGRNLVDADGRITARNQQFTTRTRGHDLQAALTVTPPAPHFFGQTLTFSARGSLARPSPVPQSWPMALSWDGAKLAGLIWDPGASYEAIDCGTTAPAAGPYTLTCARSTRPQGDTTAITGTVALGKAGRTDVRLLTQAPDDEQTGNNAAVVHLDVQPADLTLALTGATELQEGVSTGLVATITSNNPAIISGRLDLSLAAGSGDAHLLLSQGCSGTDFDTNQRPIAASCDVAPTQQVPQVHNLYVTAGGGRNPVRLQGKLVLPEPDRDTNDNERTLVLPVYVADVAVTFPSRIAALDPPAGGYTLGVDEPITLYSAVAAEGTESIEIDALTVAVVRAPGATRDALRLDSVQVEGEPCTVVGLTATCPDLSSLNGGSSATLEITATSVAAAAASVKVTVKTLSDDRNPSNDSRSTSVVVAEPRLVLGGNQTPLPLERGGTGSLNLVLSNTGPGALAPATVALTLPDKVEATGATSAGGTCTVASRAVSCPLARLAEGDAANIDLDLGGVSAGTADVAVTITSSSLQAPQRRSQPVTVGGADLAVATRVTPPGVGLGQRLTLTAEVFNRASTDSDAVLVTLTPVNAAGAFRLIGNPSATGGTCSGGSVPLCTFPAGAIPASGSVAVSVTVEGTRAGDIALRVTAAEANQTDATPTDNEDTFELEVQGHDLAVDLQVDTSPLAPSAQRSASFSLSANTVLELNGVVGTLQVPANTRLVSANLSGAPCTLLGAAATCTQGAMAGETSVSGSIVFEARPGFVGGTLSLTGRHDDPDPVTGNNRAFSVVLPDLSDRDGDGVSDGDEPGDADGDGVPDADQGNTAPLNTDLDPITVTSDLGQLRELAWRPIGDPIPGNQRSAAAPDGPPANVYLPRGAVSLSLEVDPGQTAEVTLILPPGAPATMMWAYGQQAGDPIPLWRNLVPGAVGDGRITVALTDGGLGDGNPDTPGLIEVSLAPALPELVVDAGSDASDANPGDGDCATAAGTCSLRAAIEEVNASGPAGIRFDLPSTGQAQTISVGAALVATSPVVIDARGLEVSHPDPDEETGPGVVVRSNNPSLSYVLTLSGDRSALRALAVTHAAVSGSATPVASVRVTGAHTLLHEVFPGEGFDGVRIEGDGARLWGGLYADHVNARVDGTGWVTAGAPLHVIGAADVVVRDVHVLGGDWGVVGTGAVGLTVRDSVFEGQAALQLRDSPGAVLTGSWLGLNPDGTCGAYEANLGGEDIGWCSLRSDGVEVRGSTTALIGGPDEADRVVFSSGAGVVANDLTGGVTVLGAWFGLLPDGTCDPHPTQGYCRSVVDAALRATDAAGVVFGSDEAPILVGLVTDLALLVGDGDAELNSVRHGVPAMGYTTADYGQNSLFGSVEIRPSRPRLDASQFTGALAVHDLDSTLVQLGGHGVLASDVRVPWSVAGPIEGRTGTLTVEYGSTDVDVGDSVVCGQVVLDGVVRATVHDSFVGMDRDRVSCIGTPAVFGDTYRGLDARTGPLEDIAFLRNHVAGFTTDVHLTSGVTGTVQLRDNAVGLSADQAPVFPSYHGVLIDGAATLRVSDNVIVPGATSALTIYGANDAEITGTWIGELPDGTTLTLPQPFFANGMWLGGVIGSLGDGTEAGANTIVGMPGDGVRVDGASAVAVRRNRITGSGRLALDVGGDGRDAFRQDDDDLDSGPNGRTNWPTLTTADTPTGVDLLIALDAAPSTSYVVDLYGVFDPDPSGNGELDTWLGVVSLDTDAQGLGAAVFPVASLVGLRAFSAIATGPDGSSEPGPHAIPAFDTVADLQANLFGDERVPPGQPNDVVLILYNNGPDPAVDAYLDVAVTGCASVVSYDAVTMDCATLGDGRLRCGPEGPLAPGVQVDGDLRVTCPHGFATITATAGSAAYDPQEADNTYQIEQAYGEVDFAVAFPLGIPPARAVGERFLVSVSVANQLNTSSGAVDLVTTLPDTLDLVGSGFGCTAAGRRVTCPAMGRGWFVPDTVSFEVEVVGEGAGTISLTWSGPWADRELYNDVASVEFTGTPGAARAADLRLTQALGTWTPGDPLDATTTVRNDGPDESGSIVLVLSDLPASSAAALPAACVPAGAQVICLLESLAPAASHVLASSWLPPASPATLTACASGERDDPQPSNDCASATRTATVPDLHVVAALPARVALGDAPTLEVDVGATGAVQQVQLALTVQGGLFTTDDLPPGCIATADGATCELGDLAGAVRLSVPLQTSALGPATVTVSGSHAAPDDDLSDNTSQVATWVGAPDACDDGATFTPVWAWAPGLSLDQSGDGPAFVEVDGGLQLQGASGSTTLTLPPIALPAGALSLDLSLRHTWDLPGAGGTVVLQLDGAPTPLDAAWWFEGPDGGAFVLGGPTESRARVEASPGSTANVVFEADLGDQPGTWRLEGVTVGSCVSDAVADLSIDLDAPVPVAVGETFATGLTLVQSGPDAVDRLTLELEVGEGLRLEQAEVEGLSCAVTCDTTCTARCTGDDVGPGSLAGLLVLTGTTDALAPVTATVRSAATEAAPGDEVRTITFVVGDPGPLLAWTTPSAGAAGEHVTATLAVDDPTAITERTVAVSLGGASLRVARGGDCFGVAPVWCVVPAGATLSLELSLPAVGPVNLDAWSGPAHATATIAVVDAGVARAATLELVPTPLVQGNAGVLTAGARESGDVDRGVVGTLAWSGPAEVETVDARCVRDGELWTCLLGDLPADTEVVFSLTATSGVDLGVSWLLTGPVADDDPSDDLVTLDVPVTAACPASCDDGNPCTDDLCVEGLCVHPEATGTCADPAQCGGTGVCVQGACAVIRVCDDGNPCTTDACVEGACTQLATEVGGFCADGDACAALSVCDAAGACTEALAVDCDDADDCTVDTCDSVTGCDSTYVVAPPTCPDVCGPERSSLGCEAGDAVWLDACGARTALAERCDDHDPCTLDTCEEGAGCTHTPSADPLCACTGEVSTTACAGGDVVWADPCGTALGVAVACDDADPATVDTCDDSVVPVCVHTVTGPGRAVDCLDGWSATCQDGDVWLYDGCARASGLAQVCAHPSQCVVADCLEGGCTAAPSSDPSCTLEACDAASSTPACDGTAAVLRDGCGAEIARLDCVATLGEGAVCDGSTATCVRLFDPTALPRTQDVGPVETDLPGDTEPVNESDVPVDTGKGTGDGCSCDTGGGGLGWLVWLSIVGWRRRASR